MRAVLALLAVLLTGAAQAAEPSPRTVVDAGRYPFSAIGRLNADGEGFCTAVLIGPKTVLTAAHCLFESRDNRWRKPGEIHFVAGYQRGTWLAHSVVHSYRTGTGKHLVPKAPTPAFASSDWAVLDLAEAVGGRTGWLATGTLDGQATFYEAGYRRDRPFAVSMGGPCGLLGEIPGGKAVAHDCDVIKGGSGSPLLMLGADGMMRVVAVNSMRLEQADRKGAVTVASLGADTVVGLRSAQAPDGGTLAAGAAYLRQVLPKRR